jgi:hypothetical protein
VPAWAVLLPHNVQLGLEVTAEVGVGKTVRAIAATGGTVETATGGTPEIVIFGRLKSATPGLSLLLIVKNATPNGFVFFSL